MPFRMQFLFQAQRKELLITRGRRFLFLYFLNNHYSNAGMCSHQWAAPRVQFPSHLRFQWRLCSWPYSYFRIVVWHASVSRYCIRGDLDCDRNACVLVERYMESDRLEWCGVFFLCSHISINRRLWSMSPLLRVFYQKQGDGLLNLYRTTAPQHSFVSEEKVSCIRLSVIFIHLPVIFIRICLRLCLL